MIVSIHQPNYLPWMGLIHKILESDIFVVLDDVQLVRGKNFVTRSQIKTSGGPKWITIPVHNKNDFLPNQLGKIIWDYYEKYYRNQVYNFENKENGKNLEVLSEEEFIKVHGEKPNFSKIFFF